MHIYQYMYADTCKHMVRELFGQVGQRSTEGPSWGYPSPALGAILWDFLSKVEKPARN